MNGWNDILTTKVYQGETYKLRKMAYPNKATVNNLADMRRKQGYKVRVEKVPTSIFGKVKYVWYERKK